jgi:AmmeMemoRadiSam system protein B
MGLQPAIRFFSFILIAGILFGGSFFYQKNKAAMGQAGQTDEPAAKAEQMPAEQPTRSNSFFVDQGVADLIVGRAPKCLDDGFEPDSIRGGIVNHHLLASELFSGFFCKVASRNIKRVIILAPNHFGLGGGWVIGGANDWSVGEQKIVSDKEAMEKLSSEGVAAIDDGIFRKEHGVGNLMPAVSKFFPEAKVITLAVKEKIPADSQEKLVSALKDLSGDQTMIIASLDFSHDLILKEANLRDEETLPILSELDYESIGKLNQDSEASNVDSPATLNIFLRLMTALEATQFELLGRGNSALISGQPEIAQTTSYFTAVYSVKK